MSYGPGRTRRLASGKLAISTAPATRRSSSSASSRESWHPSQDANLNTAIFGFFGGISQLLLVEQVADPRQREHRSVLADEFRSVLAMAAEPHGAFHVPLHGEIDLIFRETPALHLVDRVLHHGLRAAHIPHRG